MVSIQIPTHADLRLKSLCERHNASEIKSRANQWAHGTRRWIFKNGLIIKESCLIERVGGERELSLEGVLSHLDGHGAECWEELSL